MSSQTDAPIIEVKDLVARNDQLLAVRGISFTVRAGERLGIVGESGAGKSMTALALMGLMPPGWRAEGSILHDGVDLTKLNDQQFSSRRGRTLSMIFQDPLTALNPTARIGSQIAGVLMRHKKLPRKEALEQALGLMEQMQLPRPQQMLMAYPHELSGGQRQRIMIAMALAFYPQLVIADEPTTALDATVQKRVLQLLDRAVEDRGTSLIMITHNLAVVAAMCHRVIVMYGGRIVEQGPVAEVLRNPRHPYTSALLKCQPTLDNVSFDQEEFLPSIPGQVPGLAEIPDGCAFRNRCEFAIEQCAKLPPLEGDVHSAACWMPIAAPGHQQATGAESGVQA